jgi:hypothetical protein
MIPFPKAEPDNNPALPMHGSENNEAAPLAPEDHPAV